MTIPAGLGTLAALDPNILEAFRAAWRGVVKCTTGARVDISVDATTGDYVRASGSFLDDGFDMGDEITAVGAAQAGNNGLAVVTYVSDARLSVWRPWAAPVALVDEAAGASITLTVGAPSFVKYDGWMKSPQSGQPWLRESYQPINTSPVSLRAPTAKVRQTGIYWLTVFYPADCGTDGASRLRGKIMALIYPAADLTYNGQTVRVQSHAKKRVEEEDAWIGLPIGFVHIADALNPA